MDVAAWLRDLGLERYAQAFHDAEVTPEVLPELTDADLRELGLPLGPRKAVLKAIRDLTGPPAAEAAAEAVRAVAGPDVPPVPSEAERRQLTVLFCDLVGSTELAAQLDPEDLREVIGAYQRACAGVIGRYEGYTAKFLGDGVLAYFGWPRAHEDDAERAVRAGLELAGAVGELAPREDLSLQARVGIATGLVVVGDLIGEGPAREEAVVGETPNLAARLQALAEPGSVVVAPGTRRLLSGLFDLADLGAHDLKGFAAPVPAWRVLGPSAAEGRFEARRRAAGRLTPLVGRDQELALLLDRWHLAADGEGQVVLLSGEAGIGKSRLTQALHERLRDGGGPYLRLRYQCSPHATHSALHPVIAQLERAAGLDRDDAPAARLDKLEALLARSAGEAAAAAAPLLADLLSISAEGRYPPLNLTPQRRKDLTLDALVAQLAGLARRGPVLAVFEDAHWIDPTSLELLERLVDRAQDLPALLVVTSRPEFTPPPGWTERVHVSALALGRLGRSRGAALVARVAGAEALPAALVAEIAAKADGVPLFVEELTKTVLESDPLRDRGARHGPGGPLPPMAIPATLHDSLMARLDRLALAAKEVAQVGAVIGREFSHELLAAVAPLDEAELRQALERLVEAGLVFRRGVPPAASYAFKHALVRDAAYAGLLRGHRRQLHARIAAALEERFPETVGTEPELLAHHHTEAGSVERALGYWLRAGRRAHARSANVEALAHLDRGLGLLAGLPDAAEGARWELEFRVAQGGPLTATEGHISPRVERTHLRVRELCEQLGEVRHLVPALVGLGRVYAPRAEFRRAMAYGEELIRLGEELSEQSFIVAGCYGFGANLLHVGELAAARACLDRGVALDDPRWHRDLVASLGPPPGIGCLAFAAQPTWLLGYPEQALGRARRALALARELAHPFTLYFALHKAATLHQYRREARTVRELAEEAIALSTEQEFPFWLPAATIFRGWALAQQGERAAALAQARDGWALWRARGSEMFGPYFRCLLAEVHAGAGEVEAGLELLADASALMERTGECAWEAEQYRVAGELLLAQGAGNGPEAETRFGDALAAARRQEARSLELRAATSLARLWRDQGRRSEARDVLAPVYDWFTEGFDTPDLQDARALLDDLG